MQKKKILGISESRVKDLEFACSCVTWNSYGLSAVSSHLVSTNTDTHLFTCFSWISLPSQELDSNQESNKPSWKVLKESVMGTQPFTAHVLWLFMPSWTVKLHKNAERWVLQNSETSVCHVLKTHICCRGACGVFFKGDLNGREVLWRRRRGNRDRYIQTPTKRPLDPLVWLYITLHASRKYVHTQLMYYVQY